MVPIVSNEHVAIISIVDGPAMQCHIPEDKNFLLHSFIILRTYIIQVYVFLCKILLSGVSGYITVKSPSNVSFVGQWI